MQDFRQLLVWKRAHAFALNVRRVVETLPRAGYTDLKSQMTRAAQSIVDNIVEGCGAASRLEFARYLDISIKSTSEVDYQLEFARDLGVIPHDVWKPLAREVIEIRKMLSALRRSVVAAAARDKQSPATRPRPFEDRTSNP
jgi:four helix bundle protein